MISPAREHRLRMEAKQAAEQSAATKQPPSGSAYELLLHQLAQHKRELKAIQSSEKRSQHKKDLMPTWQPYIDETLATNAGVPDAILAQMMPWCFDTGDIARGIAIGQYLVKNDLPTPEHFVRDAPSLLAELSAESWLQSDENDKPISAAQLLAVEATTKDHDFFDEIRAKLCRAIGEALSTENPAQAIDYLKRAIALNPKVGAKGLLNRLEKQSAEQ